MSLQYWSISKLEIIAKRSIIARLSYKTSFGLYEKVDFLTFFNFLAATQQVACYRFLHVYQRSQSKIIWRKMTRHYAVVFHPKIGSNKLFSLQHGRCPTY